ncbi:MAG: divalent-cation tolerance protein CutA [Acidobacteriota bacterium]
MKKSLVVISTVPNLETAYAISESLVREHLAACVNVIQGIQSIYWWEEKVNKDDELLLFIKTTKKAYKRLEKRVKEMHPYTTPEIIALEIKKGSKSYLDWLNQSVLSKTKKKKSNASV